jgi:cytochrome b561
MRLGWRLGHPAAPVPANSPAWEAAASRAIHLLFYGLMIGLPITGWLALPELLGRKPELAGISVFGFGVPLAPNLGVSFGGLHSLGTKVGIALLVLHVAAALKHHFVNRDDVLTRMLPRAK